MRRLLPVALLSVLAVATAGLALARVGRVSLTALARGAERIVLARVQSVSTIDGMRIAKAMAQETYKGSPGGSPFYFIASPTWRCDTSDAKVGELALLFLNRTKGSRAGRERLGLPPAHVGVTPLFSIAHSGRGRMPLRSVRGESFVTLWTSDIELPRLVKTVGAYTGSTRSARLRDIVRAATGPRPRSLRRL